MAMLNIRQQCSTLAITYITDTSMEDIYVTGDASGYRFISKLADQGKILWETGAWNRKAKY